MPASKPYVERHVLFVKAIISILKEHGAREASFYDWEIDTPHGIVRFSVAESSFKRWLGEAFGRFDNVKAGKDFGANPYSGKWNHHYTDCTVEEAAADFRYQLSRILKKPA